MSDLISRQEAIRLITGYNGVMDKSVAKRLLIQMPSAQPRSTMGQVNDTAQSTNDCISRQAAIDAAMKVVSDKRTHGFNAGATRAANNIKTLPSAQPVDKDMNVPCTNAIDRQAAIDVLMEILDKPNHADFLYTDEIYNALNGLPPVQPERKRGHWIGGDGSYICSECNGNPIDFINTMGASFDAYVETPMNYCPNCGADMRDTQDA